MDAKTFDEVCDLETYWRTNPPEHEMLQVVAACLGWKPPRLSGQAAEPRPMTDDEIVGFEQLVNGGA